MRQRVPFSATVHPSSIAAHCATLSRKKVVNFIFQTTALCRFSSTINHHHHHHFLTELNFAFLYRANAHTHISIHHKSVTIFGFVSNCFPRQLFFWLTHSLNGQIWHLPLVKLYLFWCCPVRRESPDSSFKLCAHTRCWGALPCDVSECVCVCYRNKTVKPTEFAARVCDCSTHDFYVWCTAQIAPSLLGHSWWEQWAWCFLFTKLLLGCPTVLLSLLSIFFFSKCRLEKVVFSVQCITVILSDGAAQRVQQDYWGRQMTTTKCRTTNENTKADYKSKERGNTNRTAQCFSTVILTYSFTAVKKRATRNFLLQSEHSITVIISIEAAVPFFFSFGICTDTADTIRSIKVASQMTKACRFHSSSTCCSLEAEKMTFIKALN